MSNMKNTVIALCLACLPGMTLSQAIQDGWSETGVAVEGVPDYLEFKGGAVVSGVVERLWLENEMDGSLEGTLRFSPDVVARNKYPLMSTCSIDLGMTEENARVLDLPFQLPEDKSVCGYTLAATLRLGSFYQFNAPDAGGEDAVELVEVVSKAQPVKIECGPGIVRMEN